VHVDLIVVAYSAGTPQVTAPKVRSHIIRLKEIRHIPDTYDERFISISPCS
jgi:hypothetical protein